jgi:hypothetical protein
MVLRALAETGPQHGFGLAKWILQQSTAPLHFEQGTLYPELLRLEQRRWITSRWGVSENNRGAKVYALTARGQRQIRGGHACAGRVAVPPRSAMVMLAATLLSRVSEPHTHVRTTEPRILALINEGRARSETFRRLVATLDASDVTVYLTQASKTMHAIGVAVTIRHPNGLRPTAAGGWLDPAPQ